MFYFFSIIIFQDFKVVKVSFIIPPANFHFETSVIRLNMKIKQFQTVSVTDILF